MSYCSYCGSNLSPEANFCSNCGKQIKNQKSESEKGTLPKTTQKSQKKSGNKIGIVILILTLFLLVLIIIVNLGNKKTYNSTSNTKLNQETFTHKYRETKYVHNNINVRSGRGTNFSIIANLERGDEVEIDSLLNGWIIVYKDGIKQGFVLESLLKDEPIPPFEIVSWNWYTDPSFGTDGAVIWNVEIRNNTNNYVSNIKVELTTYDASGNIIDSDYTYVSGLSPGGTSSAKSYATYFGREQKAGIKIDPYSIY